MKECLTLHYSWLKNGHYIPFVNTLLPKDMAVLQGYGKIASLLYQENGIRLKPGKIKLDFEVGSLKAFQLLWSQVVGILTSQVYVLHRALELL